MPKPALDLTGRRFGRLVAMEYAYTSLVNGQQRRWWRCLCDCGNQVTKRRSTLTSGHTRSCGCIQRQVFGTNWREPQRGQPMRTCW